MPTNGERAAWAALACSSFADAVGMEDEDFPTVISDLMANLLHLAAQEGMCVESLLARAKMHYDAEITEEDAP